MSTDLKTEARYHYRVTKIKLNKHYKMFRLYVAYKLVRMANRISPEFMETYDKITIDRWFEDLGRDLGY